MLEEPTEFKCISCEETITDDDKYFQEVQYVHGGRAEGSMCYPCYESELQYVSTAIHVEGGRSLKYYISDYFAMDEYGESPYGSEALSFSRGWHSTDGWRGYNETHIEGWEEVRCLTGWTTGGWGDATAQRKQTFNEWASGVIEGDIELPVPVIIVSDLTSNVFSMAVAVWVPDGKTNELLEFLGEDMVEDLDSALV